MLTSLKYSRPDGTFVGVVNGMPYHIIPSEGYWDEAVAMAAIEMPPLEPVPEPEPVDLYALAASMRWQKEIGGIEVGGVMITTDDRSKTLLQGARTAADANPAHIEGWKTAAGWVDLTAAQIIAMSDAVRAHVSNCFALERAVAGQIADGTITTPAQVQAAFA